MEKLLDKLLNYAWLTMVAILVITAYFIFEMKGNTRMETNLDKYMPQDHPAFIYSDKAESWFDIKDGIIIALENKNGVFNTETLDTLKQLTKRFQKFSEIDKDDVTSLYTADNIIGTEDGMDVRSFYKRVPKSPEKLQQLKSNVENNEMVFGRLVSTDETVTVIIAEIGDDVFTQEFYDEILKVAHASETDDIKIYVAGRPIVEGTMALLGPEDMKRMVPIVLLVIFLVLFLTLKSFKGTMITLGVVFFSTIWAFGLMAAVNIPIYAVSTMIPVMLIAIGVADGIHLYSHLHTFIDHNPTASKTEAVKDMLHYMWKPVVMTSMTTAVGFISLLTSQVYPVKYFGIFTAFGVMVAMVFSLVFLPAGIMIFGLPKARKIDPDEDKEGHSHSKLANNFAAGVIKNKYISLVGTAVIVVLSLIGMQKIWINSSFLEKFEKDSDIVQTDKFINEHFGGTSTLNLILDANGKKDTFKEPAVLKLVDKMQKDVDDQLQVVGNTFSLADYINRMNKVMNADDEAFNTIPDDKNMIAQYLLLYEMSGDPENLNKVVDYDYEKLNVTFQLKSDNSKAINSALDVIHTYEDEFKNLGITMNYAGSGYKGLVFTDLILEGQIKSLILSLIIIVVLLSMMFRNIGIGLIGSVPIIITALISFGIMGFLGIPLNTTTALLSSIAVGIGIDYAVHFLEQYRHNAADTDDKLVAAQKTMAHSGKAIIYNAIVVIAGFMVLLFSVFPPNRELGALVSLNMFTSFVGTLTIMLVLLYMSNIYFKQKKTNQQQTLKNKKMKTVKITSLAVMLFLAGGLTNPTTAQQLTGREIIDKAYNLPTGEDQTSDLTMTLINKSGSERIRKIKQFTKDFGDVEKSIMFFVAPADVKNTSFMNWSYDSDKSDDQWIYLPALKKVKRISSESKSDYFMGSDFTYDDLGDRKLDDDTHKLLREETIDGVEYYVVESIPKDEDYMYSKTVTWIRKDNFIGLKKEFYDEDGELLKILKIKKFEDISGFLVITSSEMENVQKNHRTTMKLDNIKINTGIPASKFSERMMMRGI